MKNISSVLENIIAWAEKTYDGLDDNYNRGKSPIGYPQEALRNNMNHLGNLLDHLYEAQIEFDSVDKDYLND